MKPLLRVENVTISYQGKTVVDDISFTVEPGEILGVVGESGSGKSSIIRAVMGLLGSGGLVTGGEILYKDQNIMELSKKELRDLSGPEIAMVFQDCKNALCPIRRVGDQIYESLSEHERVSKKESGKRASKLMKKIGLTDPERILRSYPFELSGGMNQRVGICMAMLQRPSLLLADEPTSALDVTVQAQVVEELKLLRRECKTAMILVTHNIGVVEALADRVLVLKDGRVMDYGSVQQVMKNSEDEYTRALMSAVPRLRRNENE